MVLGDPITSWAEIGRMAIQLVPETKSRVLPPPNDTRKKPIHTDVSKIKKYFGFSFDATEYLRACLKWLIERERQVLAGKDVYDTGHR